MSWLGKIGATLLMLLGSIVSFSHSIHPIPSPIQNISQGSNTQNSTSDATLNALMQQIGCTDMSSCISVCMTNGASSACTKLRALMATSPTNHYQGGYAGEQNTPPNYTHGENSLPSGNIAFVGNNTPTSAAGLPACPSDNGVFDHTPLSFSDFSGIEPMGHMNGEHILPSQADHVYLDALPSEASAAVYAPGNATLLAVAESVGIAGADKGANSVKLYFSPCQSLMFALQMNTLSPQLQSELSNKHPLNVQAGATIQNVVYGNLDIPLTSGEVLGTTMNLGAGAGVDFAAADVRTPSLQFIDQGEATGMIADSYLHAVCPLDYFTSTLRSKLYALLTIKNAGANGIPACGTTMQDKPGTAQGDWYDQQLPPPAYQGINESALLAIAHYNLDPTKGIISVGTALIPSTWLGSQLIFQPQENGYINRDPSQITSDGHVYCFEGPIGAGSHGSEGHIDIEMLDSSTLKADYASGMCGAIPSLSSQEVTYSR